MTRMLILKKKRKQIILLKDCNHAASFWAIMFFLVFIHHSSFIIHLHQSRMSRYDFGDVSWLHRDHEPCCRFDISLETLCTHAWPSWSHNIINTPLYSTALLTGSKSAPLMINNCIQATDSPSVMNQLQQSGQGRKDAVTLCIVIVTWCFISSKAAWVNWEA